MNVDYSIIRSNRKTVAIHVRDGVVEVRAPYSMTRYDIDIFVSSKEKWIMSRLAELRGQTERRDSFSLDYGDTVVYRGKKYPIKAKDGGRVGFDDVSFYMPPGLSPDYIKAVCVQIYRMLAKRDLTLKTFDFAKELGKIPVAVKINGAKTRWGSCSSKKNVNYSWFLIMADDDVIDYVVVHELAHMYEMNHSDLFWQIVESVLPDYRERKARLKELQYRISNENWGV